MGEKLFAEVTAATGLPQEMIAEELGRLLEKSGIDRENLTLDDLRRVLADYVQDVLLSAKEDISARAAGE